MSAQIINFHPEPGMHPTAPPTPPMEIHVQYQTTRPIHTQDDNIFSAEKPSLYQPLKTEILSNQYLGNSFFRTSFCSISVSAIIQPWTEKTVHTHFCFTPFVSSHPWRSEFAADDFFYSVWRETGCSRREQKCFCHFKNKSLSILR